jgi:chromosome segregation ATPase
MFKCQYCQKDFSTKTNLNKHQKTTQYCLDIQQKESDSFKCDYCNKEFNLKANFNRHTDICKAKKNLEEENKEQKIDRLNDELNGSKMNILLLKKEIQNYQIQIEEKNKQIEEKNQKIEKLEDTIIGIAESKHELNTNLESYEKQIQELTIKYGGKRQKRQQIKEPNVIYILSTDLLEKERRYIFGKSKNLTARLSTYNKSDEHKIIYYQACGSESNMDLVEKFVLNKLEKYREIENRDRFILPEDKEIDFFIDVIKKSINFVLEN